MKLRVRTIIIITKKNDHALVGMTRQVTDFLLHRSSTKKDPYTMFYPVDSILTIVTWTKISRRLHHSIIKDSLNKIPHIKNESNSGHQNYVSVNPICSTLS